MPGEIINPMRNVGFKILILFLQVFSFSCSVFTPVLNTDYSAGTLRIGTYNVMNLFDPYDDPTKSDSEPPSESRLHAIADIILEADCDILAVQEVENLSILAYFNHVYLSDLYPEIILVEGNDPRGIDVGVLSKFFMEDTVSHREVTFTDPSSGITSRFSRDLLVVTWIDETGNSWTFMTTHLKSGNTWHDRIRRRSQADEIAAICREETIVSTSGSGFAILAGDLNSVPSSGELHSLFDVPFSDPARDYPYRSTHASGKVLDYILLSPDAEERYIMGSYNICRGQVADEASDHYLLSVDLFY